MDYAESCQKSNSEGLIKSIIKGYDKYKPDIYAVISPQGSVQSLFLGVITGEYICYDREECIKLLEKDLSAKGF